MTCVQKEQLFYCFFTEEDDEPGAMEEDDGLDEDQKLMKAMGLPTAFLGNQTILDSDKEAQV